MIYEIEVGPKKKSFYIVSIFRMVKVMVSILTTTYSANDTLDSDESVALLLRCGGVLGSTDPRPMLRSTRIPLADLSRRRLMVLEAAQLIATQNISRRSIIHVHTVCI